MDIAHLPIPGGHLDLLRGVVERDGEAIALSSREVAALAVLAEHSPEAVDETTLLQKAWGYRTTKTRTVSMTMSRLRGKVERSPRSPEVVLTVRGVGYRLVLTTPPAADGPPREPTRRTLLGRGDEVARVARLWGEGRRAVELVGPGGVGTSTLARHLAPDATWVPLQGIVRTEGLIRRLCEALDLEGADGEAVLRRALPDAGPMVLDAVSDLDADAVAFLGRLLPDAEGPVLLTGRHPLGLGARVAVGPLAPADALALLQLARHEADLPPVDAAAARPVLDEVGGFPLGLVLAAPLVELAAEGALGLAQDPDGDLARVLVETLALVEPEPRHLLALASAFAVPPALPVLASVAGIGRTAVLRGLHALRERGLVSLAEGMVDVPVAVATVAVDDAARTAHARWAAALPADTLTLRPHRHEIEAALATADGDALPHVLMRHLILLHTYGPRDRIDQEMVGLLPRVPSEGRRTVLLGATLASGADHAGAHAAFVQAVEQLPDDDVVFRAWAWMYRSVAATWLPAPDYDDAIACVEPMLALRDAVDDRAQWAALTINAASLLALTDEVAASARFREVDAEAGSFPSLAVTATFYRLGLEPPSAATVHYAQRQLEALGPERLGPMRWATHHLRIARGWLRVEESERGMALFEAHVADAVALAPALTRNLLEMAALASVHRPEQARRLLAWLPDAPTPSPHQRLVQWLLDGAKGDVPTDDPELAAAFTAFRDGRPVPPARHRAAVVRTLRQVADARHP